MGSVVGPLVGIEVGSLVGAGVGLTDGLDDGVMEGTNVGETDGVPVRAFGALVMETGIMVNSFLTGAPVGTTISSVTTALGITWDGEISSKLDKSEEELMRRW